MKKLTLISITFRGKRYWKFFKVRYTNGRAVVSSEVYQKFADEIGIQHGQTFTIS